MVKLLITINKISTPGFIENVQVTLKKQREENTGINFASV